MKTVAYLRVSTTRPEVQGQRVGVLVYAREHSLRIDEFVEATASAVTSPKRRRLDDLQLGVSKNAISKITGASRPTLYHFIDSRSLQPGP